MDGEVHTAFDAVSPEQVALETGWDFSLPYPSHRLEDNLIGAPPMAAVGENLVACASAYVPSDDLDQLIFVVSPRSEPMTTGLYWYLHYRRGTGDLSQIIVMDKSGDQCNRLTVARRIRKAVSVRCARVRHAKHSNTEPARGPAA